MSSTSMNSIRLNAYVFDKCEFLTVRRPRNRMEQRAATGNRQVALRVDHINIDAVR